MYSAYFCCCCCSVMVQGREDDGLGQGGSSGDGEKWQDSRFILEFMITGLWGQMWN